MKKIGKCGSCNFDLLKCDNCGTSGCSNKGCSNFNWKDVHSFLRKASCLICKKN